MDLPPEIRDRFRRHGRRGGRTRAERLSPAERTLIARRAALRRWIQTRFGAPRFEHLGLPGGARIDCGLDDLAAEKETPDSLAVCLAWPRLEREGVPLPPHRFPDADHRLYRRLEETEGALAHHRYLAVLREVESFANACGRSRVEEAVDA